MSDETPPAKARTLLQQQVETHTKNLQQALNRKKQIEDALEEIKVQIFMLNGAIMSLNQLEEASRAQEKTDATPPKSA